MPQDIVPSITVEELARKLASPDRFVVLDVREEWELALARLSDSRLEVQPMSRLAHEGLDALPAAAKSPDAEIYVLCHQGVRSAQIASWLRSRGWNRVFSVAGGIDEYAMRVDRSVGIY